MKNLLRRILSTSLAIKMSLAFAIPFIAIAFWVMNYARGVVHNQFDNQYQRDMKSAVIATRLEIAARREVIARQLRQLGTRILDDTDFRLHALVLENFSEPYLIDYAPTYMSAMGLQALEITDRRGIVLSSGHHRNDFGRRSGQLLHFLRDHPGLPVTAWFYSPDSAFPCLTALEAVGSGSQQIFLIGGVEVASSMLESLRGDTSDTVVLRFPDTTYYAAAGNFAGKRITALDTLLQGDSLAAQPVDYAIDSLRLPVFRDDSVAAATLWLVHPKNELNQLLTDLNSGIFGMLMVGLLVGISLLFGIGWMITRRLKRLAKSAEKLTLENLGVEFPAGPRDETGILSDALQRMVNGLRKSRLELRAAEQKAALGELARQVNHDIKNGFMPIRHVMRHWEEVAIQEPDELPRVFIERKGTVLDSLTYLEKLARDYSRLQAPLNPETLDVHELIEALLRNYRGVPGLNVEMDLHFYQGEALVEADRVQLRRAFENILRNAIEAIPETGRILVATDVHEQEVWISWQDNGSGIPEEIREQLFSAHLTTKPAGTGIGLSNVKRIIEDAGGRLLIESEVGKGTDVQVILPQSLRKKDRLKIE